MDKRRIPYLDVAKGIGILLVVAGHIWGNDTFSTIVYAFHVPLFIVISGVIIAYTDIAQKPFGFVIKKKFKSLIVPYILTEIIVLPLYMIKYGYSLADLRWLAIDSLILYNTKGIATWFLLNLFIAELIYLCMTKILKKDWLIQSISMIFLVISFTDMGEHYFILLLQKSLTFVFFLMVGHQYISQIKKWSNWVLVLFVPFVVIALQNKLVVMSEAIYNNPILFVLAAMLGAMVTVTISYVLCDKTKRTEKFFSFYGKNSLFVLCTHLMLTRYCIDLIWVDGPHYESVLKSVCVFLLVLGLEWLLIKGKQLLKDKRGVKDENSCICSN